MTRRTPALIVALLALLATPALADYGDGRETREGFDRHRTEIGAGMLVGGFAVGPIGGTAVGLHLDIGRQMGQLKLMGEYNFMGIGESSYEIEDPVRGVLHRGGLIARYNFAEIGGGRRTPLQGSFWLEAGLGREHIQWNEGGVLSRDDVALGFGAQLNVLIGRDSPKPKTFSIYYAFKALIAKSPTKDQMGPVTCGGPCDEPTAPSPYDAGFFFNLGLSWGR